MVSSSHEAMHRLFQEDPGVFARTARALGHFFTDPVEVSVLPTDLTEPSPLERRVDTLLRFDTAGPEGSFLLAVEAQSRRSDAKPASWAYYASYLYTKYGLPPVLLVICHDRATAAWAARHVDIGPPQWPTLTLRPLVLGPQNVPVVLDPDVARADIPLAALSAITHSDHPDIGAILKALAGALKSLGEDDASIFIELTEQGLGTAPAATTWRELMAVDLSFFRSETAQKLRAEGLAAAVVVVLERRGIALSDTDRARITSCRDRDTLTAWVRRACSVTTTGELFQ